MTFLPFSMTDSGEYPYNDLLPVLQNEDGSARKCDCGVNFNANVFFQAIQLARVYYFDSFFTGECLV